MASHVSLKPLLKEWLDRDAVCSEDETGFASSLYKSCIGIFADILRATSKSSSLKRKEKGILKEELGRLQLWGGSFCGYELEGILSQSDDLRNPVLEHMSAIGRALMKCELFDEPRRHLHTLTKRSKAVLTLTKPPINNQDLRKKTDELGVLIEKADLITQEDQYGGTSEIGEDSDCDGAGVSNTSTIGRIRFHNQCLMDLIPTMEQTLIHMNHAKRVEKFPSAAPFQVTKSAQQYVLKVCDKFPNADRKLAERLGEANWQRHVELRQVAERISGCDLDGEALTMPQVPQPSLFHDSGLGTSLPPGSSYAISTASHTSFISTDTAVERGSLRVPPTPSEVFEGKPFKCEICGTTLGNIKNRVDWKRHVFVDLKPYICTFPVCEDELVKFPTRKLWADHEFNEHRIVRLWVCPQCPEKFLSPGDWRAHLTYMHKTAFSGLPFQFALAAAERRHPQPIGDQKCPLCLDVPASQRRTFEAHVGRHMEEIALAALPREIEESDPEDDSLARIANEEIEKSPKWVKRGRDSESESTSVSPLSTVYDPDLFVDSSIDLEPPMPHKSNCEERDQRIETELEKDKEEAKEKQRLEGIREEDGSYNPPDTQRHEQTHQQGHNSYLKPLSQQEQAQTSRHLTVACKVSRPVGAPVWPCTACGKKFTNRSNCARHMKTIHSGSDPFRCRECDKAFSRLDNLKLHVSRHRRKVAEPRREAKTSGTPPQPGSLRAVD